MAEDESLFLLDGWNIGTDFYEDVQGKVRSHVTQEAENADDLNNPYFIPKLKTDPVIRGLFYDVGKPRRLETLVHGPDMYKIGFSVEGGDRVIYFSKNGDLPSLGLPHNYAELLTNEEILSTKIEYPEFREAALFFYKIGESFIGKDRIPTTIHLSRGEAKKVRKYYFVMCFCICEGSRLHDVHDFIDENIRQSVSLVITDYLLEQIRTWKKISVDYNDGYATKNQKELILAKRKLRIVKTFY